MDKSLEKAIADWTPQNFQSLFDPFMKQGQTLLYKAEHNFIIKIQEKPQVVQTLKETQLLTVKIVIENQHESPKNVKIQLSSDTEIYFSFSFECNDWEFKRIKANQNFVIQFREYPDFIIKNFERLNQPDKYFGVFTIFSQAEGKLNLIRKSEFKDESIMEFDFVKAAQEKIQKSIQYRYDLMKKNYDFFYSKYEVIADIIRQKNPSLMIQINKMLKKKN